MCVPQCVEQWVLPIGDAASQTVTAESLTEKERS